MSALGSIAIQNLLEPYTPEPLTPEVIEKIQRYLAVFAHWSTRMNLSTVTEPEHVIQRHFGEGLVMARALPACRTILDLGSGAGFPGLPIALVHQSAKVTLAESQKKKAAFLKEASWMMGLGTAIWPNRAEDLPLRTSFEAVTLRAVDNMSFALGTAHGLLAPGGTLAFFAGERDAIRLPEADWVRIESIDLPQSPGHIVVAQLA